MKLKESKIDIEDGNDQIFYTLDQDCKGELLNETLKCSIDWNLQINPENGRMKFIIKKEGRDESLDSPKDDSFAIEFLKDKKILKEDRDCKLEKSDTYKRNCICSSLDWRRFLKNNPIEMSILIKSDSCCFKLGKIKGIENLNEIFPKCIGDAGPGAGTIFYDKGPISDSDNSEEWRYLEVGQAIGPYPFGYYKSDPNDKKSKTRTEIGSGKENTDRLVNAMGEKAYNLEGKEVPNYAAKVCQDLSVGDCKDWFLPSRDELELIYLNLKGNKNLDGGYDEYDANDYFDSLGVSEGSFCWSSSEYSNNDNEINYYFSQDYAYNNLGGVPKDGVHYVLPVRRFK